MKQSAILDIFYGVKSKRENLRLPKETIKTLSTANKIYDQLKSNISTEHMNLFQQYIDTIEKYWAEEAELNFVEGFKLGLQIGMETKTP